MMSYDDVIQLGNKLKFSFVAPPPPENNVGRAATTRDRNNKKINTHTYILLNIVFGGGAGENRHGTNRT